jgi:hypothetical protein
MCEQLPDRSAALKTAFKRFCIAVVFSVAFGYIEAAVVVYLRAIFYPEGFTFPLVAFGIGALEERLLGTEMGREAASLLLIFTGSWLFGHNRRERFAYFLTIFAVWDIFYYIWLKVLLDWPASIMDWDILFLIPSAWASPVLAPVLVSVGLFVFAGIILWLSACGERMEVRPGGWFGFCLAGFMVVVSFCIAGQHTGQSDYRLHFSWLLFGAGYLLAVVLFARCLWKSRRTGEAATDAQQAGKTNGQ